MSASLANDKMSHQQKGSKVLCVTWISPAAVVGEAFFKKGAAEEKKLLTRSLFSSISAT